VDRITNRPARTGPTKLAFHASRIVIDAGVLISMAAMSMPFVTTEGADTNSMVADALPVILLLAPIFLVTLLPDHSRPIPMPLGWISLVLGVAAFPYAVVKYLDAANLAATLEGNVGFGARLLIFGTFVTLAGIAIGLARGILKLPSGGTFPARRPAPAQQKAKPAQGPRPGTARTDPAPAGSDPRRTQPRPDRTETGGTAPSPRPTTQRPTGPDRDAGSGER